MTRKRQTPPAPPRKKDLLVDLLRRDGGVALAEISHASGWLPHTARAMLTGLRKKGVTIAKNKVEGTTRYSIAQDPGL
jgi:DNA-binding IclR family transcriptional regulator